MTTAPANSPAAAASDESAQTLRINGSRPRRSARRDPRLEAVAAKVEAGERLTFDDGMLLYATPDIWSVCALADNVRRRLHGDTTYYNINRHLNYSNLCALSCTFCSFYRKKGEAGGYEHTIDEIRQIAREASEAGATELHIVGGLHPWLPFEYYTDMMQAIRETTPALHIKAFTAVEIVHFARISKRGKEGYEGIKQVLSELKDAGLGSLPGGGAEVFDDRVHDVAFKGKIRAGTWLDVHRAAHELGLNSNATMLYGHIEGRDERIRHMMTLREAQDLALARCGYEPEGVMSQGIEASRHQGIKQNVDSKLEGWPGVITLTKPGAKLPMPASSVHSMPRCLDALMPTSDASIPSATGGYFQTIIPLPFFPDESELEDLPGPTGLENLRTLAIARLMLDNFPHVKAFWIMQTLHMAQLMLQSGADDIDGTVVWYDITKVGNTTTHQETTVFDLTKAIREAGFTPVERDTLYRPVVRDGKTWRIAAHSS